MSEGKPEGLKRSFRVTGMTCATCSRTVEKALRKTECVSFAAVNLATETAFIVLERDIPQETIEAAVRAVGYDVAYGSSEDLDRKRYEQSRRNLFVSWAVTAPSWSSCSSTWPGPTSRAFCGWRSREARSSFSGQDAPR